MVDKRSVYTSFQLVDMWNKQRAGMSGMEIGRRLMVYKPEGVSVTLHRLRKYVQGDTAGIKRFRKSYVKAAQVINQREQEKREKREMKSRAYEPLPGLERPSVPAPEEPRKLSDDEIAQNLINAHDNLDKATLEFIKHTSAKITAMEEVIEAAQGSNWREMLRKKMSGEIKVREPRE